MKISKGLIYGIVLVSCFLGAAFAKTTPGGPTTHCITTTTYFLCATGTTFQNCIPFPANRNATLTTRCSVTTGNDRTCGYTVGAASLNCVRQDGAQFRPVIATATPTTACGGGETMGGVLNQRVCI